MRAGVLRVLGITALVYVVGTLLGLVLYARNSGPPATPVGVENRTPVEIDVRLVGEGCEGLTRRVAAGETTLLHAARTDPVGCRVLATDVRSGESIARISVVRESDRLPARVLVTDAGVYR